MKKFLAPFAVAVLVFGVASVVIAKTAKEAPETIKIADCQAKKAAVDFPHAKHNKLECKTCHHNQEALKANTDEVVKPCRDCHVNPEKAETPKCAEMSAAKNPFHISCVGCHKAELAKDATKKLPVKCEECHPKA
jgi:hypothetical protein